MWKSSDNCLWIFSQNLGMFVGVQKAHIGEEFMLLLRHLLQPSLAVEEHVGNTFHGHQGLQCKFSKRSLQIGFVVYSYS